MSGDAPGHGLFVPVLLVALLLALVQFPLLSTESLSVSLNDDVLGIWGDPAKTGKTQVISLDDPNLDGAGVRLFETGDEAKCRGLARAGGSKQDDEGPVRHGQVHVHDGLRLAERFGNAG